jgi:hypothetical protein
MQRHAGLTGGCLHHAHAQVGELFLASSPGSSRAPGGGGDISTIAPASVSTSGGCLLQQSAVEDEVDASELLFGGRATSGGTGLNDKSPQQQQQGPEMEAWRKANKATQVGVQAMEGGKEGEGCQEWQHRPQKAQRVYFLAECTCAKAEAPASPWVHS